MCTRSTKPINDWSYKWYSWIQAYSTYNGYPYSPHYSFHPSILPPSNAHRHFDTFTIPFSKSAINIFISLIRKFNYGWGQDSFYYFWPRNIEKSFINITFMVTTKLTYMVHQAFVNVHHAESNLDLWITKRVLSL